MMPLMKPATKVINKMVVDAPYVVRRLLLGFKRGRYSWAPAGHKLARTLFHMVLSLPCPRWSYTNPRPPPISHAFLPHLAASVFVRVGGLFYVTNNTNMNDSCFCMATFGIAKEDAAGVMSATPLITQGATATPPLPPPPRTMAPAFRCHFLVRPCPSMACCRAGLLRGTGHPKAARFFQKITILLRSNLYLQHQEKLLQQRGRQRHREQSRRRARRDRERGCLL